MNRGGSVAHENASKRSPSAFWLSSAWDHLGLVFCMIFLLSGSWSFAWGYAALILMAVLILRTVIIRRDAHSAITSGQVVTENASWTPLAADLNADQKHFIRRVQKQLRRRYCLGWLLGLITIDIVLGLKFHPSRPYIACAGLCGIIWLGFVMLCWRKRQIMWSVVGSVTLVFMGDSLEPVSSHWSLLGAPLGLTVAMAIMLSFRVHIMRFCKIPNEINSAE